MAECRNIDSDPYEPKCGCTQGACALGVSVTGSGSGSAGSPEQHAATVRLAKRFIPAGYATWETEFDAALDELVALAGRAAGDGGGA